MTELRIKLLGIDSQSGQAMALALQSDLDRSVGEVRQLATDRPSGAKGGAIPDALQFALVLLATPAATKLIETLSAYLIRDQSVAFEVEGPGGKVKITAAGGKLVTHAEIKLAVEQVMGDRSDA